MRLSMIIAGHNEGDLLLRTIQSCADTLSALRHEIIIADDASTDGSIELALKRFPRIKVVRHPDPKIRLGPSPTKDLGARAARGQVLLFLDGHCKPEPGAIRRLVESVDLTDGQAILTPAIPTLNIKDWRNRRGQTGHGYSMDLLRFNPRWIRKCDMMERRVGSRIFYESPALIGCCLALSADLYEKLRGFDPHMFNYGVEDLDFGLKSWLMGHPILHDPESLIGHRFQRGFAGYQVAKSHVIVNQLRSARKNLSETFWNLWLDQARNRLTRIQPRRRSEHHEGLWAQSWLLFNEYRQSVEEERAYLLGRRTQDELWFAHKFHLDWPTLSAPVPESTGKKFRSATARALAAGSSPSPSPSASPSPYPCQISADPDLVCLGQEVNFTVEYEGPFEPEWSAVGGDPDSGTGTSFTTKWATPGEKTVEVTCPYEDTETHDETTVQVMMVEELLLSARTACIGGEITIDAFPDPDIDYPDGSPIWSILEKPEGSTLETPPAGQREVTITLDMPGSYTLQAQCGDSAASKTMIAVKVRELEPEGEDKICLGGEFRIWAIPNPSDAEYPEDSPKWSFTNIPAGSDVSDPPDGANPAVFTPDLPGDYTLAATCGQSTEFITVHAVTIRELLAAGDTDQVCVGGSLNVWPVPEPSDADYPQDLPIWEYTEKPDGSNISDPADGDNPASFEPDTPGNYVLQATCGNSVKSIALKGIGCKCKNGQLTPGMQIKSFEFTGVYDRLHEYPSGDKIWPGWDPNHSGKYGKAIYDMTATLTITNGKLSLNPPLPEDCNCTATIRILLDEDEIARASDIELSGTEITLPDFAADLGEIPLIGTVHKDVFTFAWEISFDDGANWCSLGSTGPVTIYWIAGAPTIPNDKKVFDLALEKACGYVNGGSAYASLINSGIPAELDYRANLKSPNGMDDDSGGVLEEYDPINNGGQCITNAYLLQYLLKSIGAPDAGTVRAYWGGTNILDRYWCGTNQDCNTFTALRPARALGNPANPRFKFHAMTTIGTTTYDPSYGLTTNDPPAAFINFCNGCTLQIGFWIQLRLTQVIANCP